MYNKQIGKKYKSSNLSDEYLKFAQQDEESALCLKKNGFYRQSIYFIIQAMEKYIRAQIFQRLNPDNIYARNFNKNHSLEEAIDLVISTYVHSSNTTQQDHVKSQLLDLVNTGIKSTQLHNNLRYPLFTNHNAYSYKYTIEDVKIMENKLLNLKQYLENLHLL